MPMDAEFAEALGAPVIVFSRQQLLDWAISQRSLD